MAQQTRPGKVPVGSSLSRAVHMGTRKVWGRVEISAASARMHDEAAVGSAAEETGLRMVLV